MSFVATSRVPGGGIPEEGCVPCIPTLPVEVVSPGDLDQNLRRQLALYLRAGVERVWLVRSPDQTVTVYRQGGDAHVYGLDVTLTNADAGFSVEGFELPVRTLFA